MCALLIVSACGEDPDPSTPPAAAVVVAEKAAPAVTGALAESPAESPAEAPPQTSEDRQSVQSVPPFATVDEIAGRVTMVRTLEQSGEPTELKPGTELQARDFIRLRSDDALVSLTFASGARLHMRGVGSFGTLFPDAELTRVWLVDGTLEAEDPGRTALEIGTPYDAALTLLGASARMKLVPGKTLTIERRAPGQATVTTEEASIELGEEPWLGSARDHARLRECSGDVVIRRGELTKPAKTGDRLDQGDRVVVDGDDARARVEFPDGCRMTLVGRSALQLVLADVNGRRVHLLGGVLEQIAARGVALEIQTHAASLVLQRARATAEVRADGSVEFRKIDGQYTKVWANGKQGSITDGRWTSE